MEIRFPGGKQVEAVLRHHVVRTDQPVAAGGEDSAPSPFDLFLASLGTCSGYYVLAFCQKRGIPFDEITLQLDTLRDRKEHKLTRIEIRVILPDTFPEEYVAACIRSASQCAVKKHLQEAPDVEITAEHR